MSVKIPAEVAFALGVPQDPIAVWNRAFREMTTPIRDLLIRVSNRLPSAEFRTRDIDDPKTTHRIKLRPTSGASSRELQLKFAIIGKEVPNGAALIVDEARRMALKQGVGPKVSASKSLDGEGEFRALDSSHLIGDEVWRTFGVPVAGGYVTEIAEGRGLDGSYRSVLPVAAILGVLALIIPVLVAIIPIVLPAVIDGGGKFIEALKSGTDPLTAAGDVLTGKDTAGERAAEEAAAKDAEDNRNKLLIAGGVLAAGIVAVLVIRRMKGAK